MVNSLKKNINQKNNTMYKFVLISLFFVITIVLFLSICDCYELMQFENLFFYIILFLITYILPISFMKINNSFKEIDKY